MGASYLAVALPVDEEPELVDAHDAVEFVDTGLLQTSTDNAR